MVFIASGFSLTDWMVFLDRIWKSLVFNGFNWTLVAQDIGTFVVFLRIWLVLDLLDLDIFR